MITDPTQDLSNLVVAVRRLEELDADQQEAIWDDLVQIGSPARGLAALINNAVDRAPRPFDHNAEHRLSKAQMGLVR